MFDFLRSDQEPPSIIDEPIVDVLLAMKEWSSDPTGEEYQLLTKTLEQLVEVRNQRKPRRVSPDVVVSSAANLLGIAMIVSYEQRHVITSKALQLLRRTV